MTEEERTRWEDRLIEEADRIFEIFKEVVPEKGHIGITIFPGGHIDVGVSTGEAEPMFILNAWRCDADGTIRRGAL